MKAAGKITHHWQLDVYKLSVEAGMQVFQITKQFPREETYSLTDQIRRSSRAVNNSNASVPYYGFDFLAAPSFAGR